MQARRRGWKDISISRKLYFVVGGMALLIAGELVVLSFAMDTLSAVRAFVEGEGLWSKAQKNAAFNLQRYSFTGNELDYQTFIRDLEVPEGDRRARVELEKPKFDRAIVREGFTAGKLHPDDIDPIIRFLRRLSGVSYVQNATAAWRKGDDLIVELKKEADAHRALVLKKSASPAQLKEFAGRISELNRQMTEVETDFSAWLGAGSRALERGILSILLVLVLTVESFGLTLTFLTTRSLSRGLANISDVANAIGRGEFTARAPVESYDEIGRLSESVNQMGALLEKTYRNLEDRVRERTEELHRALQTRDQFLSIASHELRTPLSSLSLQSQLRKKKADETDFTGFGADESRKMLKTDERQVLRLVRLVNDMLDISRINTGRFEIQRELVDMVALVRDSIEHFSTYLNFAKITVVVHADGSIRGTWDPYRIEQVVTNLLTNAMKYGNGSQIEVRVWRVGTQVKISVTDRGIGISTDDQERIFRPFERAAPTTYVAGMGLGLHIVREIVKAHGGDVQVRSSLGKGSEFTVTLPIT